LTERKSNCYGFKKGRENMALATAKREIEITDKNYIDNIKTVIKFAKRKLDEDGVESIYDFELSLLIKRLEHYLIDESEMDFSLVFSKDDLWLFGNSAWSYRNEEVIEGRKIDDFLNFITKCK
jgi:hypothetical protein